MFGAALQSNAWHGGQATAVVRMTDSEQAQTSSHVGYLSKWNGTKWTCAGRDSACTQSYWQIQSFRTDIEQVKNEKTSFRFR
jgi:ribonuclease HI